MIRLSALYLFGFGLAAYAWRDWFKALCGLILMMAVIEHPDMPKTLFGIQGLNPWNIVLLFRRAGLARRRRREGLRLDLPRGVSCPVPAVPVRGGRQLPAPRPAARPAADDFTLAGDGTEYLVNTLKWVVPGLLLFDGCRSRERFTMATLAVPGRLPAPRRCR